VEVGAVNYLFARRCTLRTRADVQVVFHAGYGLEFFLALGASVGVGGHVSLFSK
jgi:hypothetical protein